MDGQAGIVISVVALNSGSTARIGRRAGPLGMVEMLVVGEV